MYELIDFHIKIKVHDPWKYRLLKLPLFSGFKPVVMQFCTNRRHTRTCTFLARWANSAYP